MATQSVDGYTGQCRLQITKTAIIVSLSNGEELATWLYNCIRQFNAVDCCFSFTSGRRGPFGVGEYCFELPQKKVAEIQKKISGYTGAIFANNHNYSGNTLSASTNVSNPSKPKVPVSSDRYRSESETASSTPLSSNLYPLTNLSNPEVYQNTGIKRAVAPPLPAKDHTKLVAVQNDTSDVKYANAMKGAPKPMPRTMKPSLRKTTVPNDNKAPSHSPPSASSLPSTDEAYANGSVTHSERAQIVPTSNPAVNPVGGYSDLNRDPLKYGDMVCSPHEPTKHHRFFSPSPPAVNSGYSDVDYDVIRRNREMGKFSDPNGAYKDAKGEDTYDVPSSLLVSEDTYDVPRPTRGKFEDIPDVYDDDRKQPSPNDLYSVPTSNQQASKLYDRLLPTPQAVSQTHNVPPQDQIYDNPSKPSLPKAAYGYGNQDSLYDTPQSNQPVIGGHETYDVVPSRKAYSYSPQRQVVEMPSKSKKPSYENIGPRGEILGEIVADQLRQDLLSSLNGGDNCWTLKPLKDVSSKFSRSCDFLNEIGREPTKRFSSAATYRRSILPQQEIAQGGTVPVSSWHTYKLHRRMSGSLGDVPTVVDSDDDGTYVVLNKTEKPNIRPPLPTSNHVATGNLNGVEDDGDSNDMYITMNRSPSHSTSSIVDTATLPKGYIRMNTAKQALMAAKSGSIDMGGKKTSPTNSEGKRSSDLVWPNNSRWSQWNPQVEQSRKSSGDSDVFSPPPVAAVADEHPIVVSKPSARPKRSILLKGVSPQAAGKEKRMGE